MPQAGILPHMDASFHQWLGDDGPQFTLLLVVDDATSAVVNAVFSPEEDTRCQFSESMTEIFTVIDPSGSTLV